MTERSVRPGAAAPLLLACALFAGAAFAQADAGFAPVPTGHAQTVEPSQVRLGEPFVRTVTVTHPRAHRYELRMPSEWGAFELLEHARSRDDSGDEATTTFTLKLSAFELGTLTLPPLTFEIASGQGAGQWRSPPATIEVVTSLPDDAQAKGQDLYDIRPPEEVTVPSYVLLWALLAAVVTALLAWLAWKFWTRPRTAKAADAGPPLPLDVRTRQALFALANDELPQNGRIKEFYVRLTGIVRGYLGERYRVEALECTTSELLERMGRIEDPALPGDALRDFLTEADLVKFAKAQMTPEDCARGLEFAFKLVDQTTPPPPQADAPERKLP